MNNYKFLPELPVNLSQPAIDQYREKVKLSNIDEQLYIDEIRKLQINPTSKKVVPMVAASAEFSHKSRSKVTEIFSEIIKNWLKIGEFEEAVVSEVLLYSSYLKRLETEHAYDDFFRKISSAYRQFLPNLSKASNDGKGFLFVLHTGVLLAHVNPLLTMLKTNGPENNKAARIGVVVLGTVMRDFFEEFSGIGVELYSCNQIKLTSEKIVFLEKIRLDHGYRHVIWQCLPVWLCFAERFVSNLSWWSVKFHPGIMGLNKYIGSLGGEEDFHLNGNYWDNFTAPINILNLDSALSINWQVRQKKFGCFTRDELIDNQLYWQDIQVILREFTDVEFHYTGRARIHDKWIENDKDVLKRIKFLGWLGEPEKKISEYAFLLDPYPLGHGNMTREALAAQVPIVYPDEITKKANSTIHKLLISNPDIQKEIYKSCLGKSLRTSYIDNDELVKVCGLLLNDSAFNQSAGALYRSLVKSRTNRGAWSKFTNILEKDHHE